jgi:hypothetical protein
MKLLHYGIWIFLAGLFPAASYAQGIMNDSMGNGSGKGVAPATDSARLQESESGNMYRSANSSMRRDVPRTESVPDTSLLPQRIRIPDTATIGSVLPKPADSLHVSQNATTDQTSAEPRIKLTKKSIIIAAGSCGLIGCGIVAYLLKNSKKDDVVSRPAGIPPPPDPPQ